MLKIIITSLLLLSVLNLIRSVENEIYWSKNLTAIDKSQYDGYHDIEVGISIKLECFANDNITWSYPKNYIPFITYQFSSPTFEYRSTFSIVKTNYSHTGSYGCQIIKNEKTDADVVEVSLNLFVNDPKHLMKTEGEETSLVETPSDPLERKFIPCLVTNSKLTPTLYNGNHSYINGTEVIYYPTKGFEFLISIPLGSIKKLECKIDSPDFAIIPIKVLYEGRRDSGLTILSEDGIGTGLGISITNSNPKEGDNVTIYCTFKANFSNIVGIYGKKMQPNGIPEVFHYKMNALEYVPKDKRNSTFYRVARDLYPIHVSDSGEYECFHNKSNGHSFEIVSKRINITVLGIEVNVSTKKPSGQKNPSSSQSKLFASLYTNSIFILVAIILSIR